MLLSGDLPDLGLGDEGRWAKLARRDGPGVTPLAECSEFMEAFRRRVGVAERDGGATEADELRKGLRMALPGRGELGGWSAVALSGLGAAGRPERGVLAGDDGAMVRRFSDCASSPSPSWASPLLWLFWAIVVAGVAGFLGGDGGIV